MRPLRALALASVLTSLSVGPSPASAAPLHWDFVAYAHVDCFGCDVPSPCHADLVILGASTGTAETISCITLESSGVMCFAHGFGYGTLVGTSGTVAGATLNLTWTRVGNGALITVTGDTNGVGYAHFLGRVACGEPMDGVIVGSISGL